MPLTNFPTQVDTFPVYVDVSPADMVDIEAWKALRAIPNRTTQQEQDYLDLSAALATKMVNAQTINKIHEAIVAIESSFSTSVGSYLSNQTEAINAEIAKFTYRNAWSNVTSYAVKNIVTRNGNSYICKTANTGIDPATDSTSTYWGKVAEKGDKGDQGDPGLALVARGEYSAATTYVAGDMVYSGKTVWYAKQGSTGQTLSEGAFWGIVFQLEDDVLIFKNKNLYSGGGWIQSNQIPDYKYVYLLELVGVDETMVPNVFFNHHMGSTVNLSPYAETFDGGIMFFAMEPPDAAISIETIICRKV